MLGPLELDRFLISGTITIIPKKPKTTDGIPESKAIALENNCFNFPFAYFATKTEVKSPRGTAKRRARKVSSKLEIIIAKIPNSLLLGLHTRPNKNCLKPIVLIVLKDGINKNSEIVTIKAIEIVAARAKSTLAHVSLFPLI
jgi:hypothetical protein